MKFFKSKGQIRPEDGRIKDVKIKSQNNAKKVAHKIHATK